MDGPSPPVRKRRRGRKIALWKRSALVLLLLAVAGGIAFRIFVLDIDRYRSVAVAALEEATGLPASLGKLGLTLFPAQRITVSDLSLGEGDFRVSTGRITVELDLSGILSRRLTLESVHLEGVTLSIPGDTAVLQEKVDALRAKFDTPGEGEAGGFELNVNEVVANGARLYRGDDTGPLVEFSTKVTGATLDEIAISIESALPQYGANASLNADLTITRGGDEGAITSIAGTGRIEALEIAKLPIEDAPEAVLWADFKAEGRSQDLIAFTLEGGLDSETAAALAGAFAGGARWDHGTLTVDEFKWDAPGVAFTVKATRYEDGRIACQVPKATVSEAALADVAAMVKFGDYQLASQRGARFEAENLLLGMSAEGKPYFDEGNVFFRGIDILDPAGAKVTAGIHGRFEVEQGLIHVRELQGDGFTLTGSLSPDLDAKTVALDLKGSVDLTRDRLALVAPADAITQLRGALRFDRIAGTFVQGGGVPEDMVVQGSLSNGRLGIVSGEFEGLFAPITAQFVTNTEGIETTVRARSEELGALAIEGRYIFDAAQWSGTLTGNVAQIAKAFMPEGEQGDLAGPVLDEYGNSTFDATVRLPSEDSKGIVIRAVRRGTPPFEVVVALDENADGALVLGAIEAKTRVRLDGLKGAAPEWLTIRGPAGITFSRDPDAETFTAVADLSACSVQGGEHFHKRPGGTLVARVTGEASGERWAVATLQIDCLGVPLAFDVDGETVRGRNIKIDLARWAGLLPEGGSASGTVALDFQSSPLEGSIGLDKAGFVLNDELRLDSVSGNISFDETEMAVRNLAVRGAGSDCLVTATYRDERWRGTLTGPSFNADAVLALLEAAEEFAGGDSTGAEASEAAMVVAQFDVALDKVFYKRGTVERFRAKIDTDEKGIRIRDLSLRPYTGSVRGTVDILYAANGTQIVDIDLTIEGADARIFDEIAFEETRKFGGIVTGRVDFRAPLGTQEELMRGANGTIVWSAQNGSFGKLGWATRFLTVLRATEIINLRAPALRDQGLTYDTCSGKLTFRNGVMTLEDASLERPAYTMEASGVLDYNQETTDAEVVIGLLESVSQALDRVPVVRELVDIAIKPVRVQINVSGSPYAPNFRVAAGKTIVDVPTEIIRGVVDAAKDTLKNLLRRNKN